MWDGRGSDQVAIPQGSRLTLSGESAVVTLLNCAEPGLDSLRFQGYRVDAEGRPTFLYALGPVAIEDHIAPAEEGAFLRRVIVLRTEVAPSPSLRVRASVAKTIHDAGEKTYVVNDRT